MNIFSNMLKEELENSLKIKERFLSELNEVPVGSLNIKNIKGHPYYYLNIREGDKVKSQYLGKLSKAQIKEYKDLENKRKKYRQSIKELNQQIKYLRRVLNVRSA
jgi:hypothetical protein